MITPIAEVEEHVRIIAERVSDAFADGSRPLIILMDLDLPRGTTAILKDIEFSNRVELDSSQALLLCESFAIHWITDEALWYFTPSFVSAGFIKECYNRVAGEFLLAVEYALTAESNRSTSALSKSQVTLLSEFVRVAKDITSIVEYVYASFEPFPMPIDPVNKAVPAEERVFIHSVFAGKKREDLNVHEIEQVCIAAELSFLTVDGFLYYLPALATFSLVDQNPEIASSLAWAIDNAYVYEKNDLANHLNEIQLKSLYKVRRALSLTFSGPGNI